MKISHYFKKQRIALNIHGHSCKCVFLDLHNSMRYIYLIAQLSLKIWSYLLYGKVQTTMIYIVRSELIEKYLYVNTLPVSLNYAYIV